MKRKVREHGDFRTKAQKQWDSEWDKIRLPILLDIEAKEQRRARNNSSHTK